MHRFVRLASAATLIATLAFSALAQADENCRAKLAEDPTQVVTQLGVSYGGSDVRLSGSLGLDSVRKLNASVQTDGKEWRIGGSWLFDFGIANFKFGRNEFDNGASQTSYSVGTFFPLSRFGFEPAGWQIFPMTGYTYSDGEVACDSSVDTCGEIEIDPNDTDAIVFIPVGSSSGYLGAFALKPLTRKWTLSSFIAGSKGSGGYSGTVAGAGTGYAISKRHSFTVFVFAQDNTYGDDQKISVAYRFQLK